MKNLKGKKVKELSIEEREYLEKSISGDYMMDDDGKNKEGMTEVTIDFESGLAVKGWIINTENEIYYELDDDALIYDPRER